AYGIAFAEPAARIDLYTHKVMQGATAEQLAGDALAGLADDEDAFHRAERAFALAAIRADLLELLRVAETTRSTPFGLDGIAPAQLFGSPGVLERALASPERRKEMQARAKALAKAAPHDDARAALQSLLRVSKEWREEEPSVFAKADVQEGTARALSALSVDAALEKLLDQAEGALLHRSGQESAEVEAEYERGKLYLFAFEDRPMLRGRAQALQMGHLFCDVKDFTRRTVFLKEAVVADFLSREFYTPILTAAARHHHGADHLHDKGGIYLNNLLGDAVSFSGDVVALVALAHDIRRALNSYARRLDSESSSETVAKSIASIEQRTAARRTELQQEAARAQAALRAGVKEAGGEDPRAHLSSLQQELSRLEEERQSEIALAAGEKLEAGIFISYGAAPEVATFEDHVFGSMKVAIAEKINESARGTARNGGVRARIDSLVKQARAARGTAEVACPFAVYVSQPLSIPVPPEAELAVRGCLEDGDTEGAELMLQESVRQFVARLSQDEGLSGGGDIYNGGAALSEEALRAYIQARGGELTFLRRSLGVAALHPSIAQRFVFPMQTLQLVAAVAPDGQSLHELYVHVGRALFKGFEKTGGLGVYEMVPPSSALFSLLAQHHLPGWLVEHEQGTGEEEPRSEATGT
ncbi:MAG TPA: hypothetical protein VE964_14925, partial [Myxococcales bacterium]|nr:hypothetical protein [Myxococcales bacterium]